MLYLMMASQLIKWYVCKESLYCVHLKLLSERVILFSENNALVMRLEAFLLLLFFACLSCLTKTYLALVTKQSEHHNITANIPNNVPAATRQNVHYNLDVIKLNSKGMEEDFHIQLKTYGNKIIKFAVVGRHQ